MAFTQDVSPGAVRPNNNDRTPVRSEPMVTQRARNGSEWAIGTALIVFGAIGWLTGARYTLFGWVAGLNLFLDWMGLPLALPTPVGWWILAMIPIGLVYSRVEMQALKVHKRHGSALALFVVGWLLIVFTDVITTYLGVRTPAPDAWPITQTIASSAGLSIVWAAILTFVSDWLILGAIQLLKR